LANLSFIHYLFAGSEGRLFLCLYLRLHNIIIVFRGHFAAFTEEKVKKNVKYRLKTRNAPIDERL
jgi:hypothetical protein